MPFPRRVQLLPEGVYIEWDDGVQRLFPHRFLRGNCPCAGCIYEMTGKRHVFEKDVPEDVVALDWMQVGRYAIRFLWSDGHETGIYPFAYLRALPKREEER
ncbi:MAG: DUF971 domain-containing protein [Chloroflexi bacterium]|nr:DUF971 domain-containing protein [Chloroflexota bacterium]